MQQLILDTRTKFANYTAKFNKDERLHQQVESLQKSLVKSNEEKQFLATELELLKSQILEKEKQSRCECGEKLRLFPSNSQGIPLKNVDLYSAETKTSQIKEDKHPDFDEISTLKQELEEWKLKCKDGESIITQLRCDLAEKKEKLENSIKVAIDEHNLPEDFCKEMVLREENLRREMEAEKLDLASRLEESSQQINDYKRKITQMKMEMEEIKEKEGSLQSDINKAQNKETSLLNQMRDLQQKHNEIQMIVAEQQKQLQSNEGELKKLESIKLDLNQQLESEQLDHRLLQARYTALQMERDNHLQQLRTTLEEAAKEKRELQEKYEKELEHLRSCNTERDYQLMDDYEWKLREIERDYKQKMDNEKKKQSEALAKLKENLQSGFEQERQEITKEKDTLQEQVKEIQSELKNQSHLSEIELRQLRGVTEELQKGMKVASAEVEDMRMAEDRLREELSKTEEKYENAKRQVSKLQYDICDLKELHSKRLKSARDQSKQLVENAKLDEESFWKEHFRQEQIKLTAVLEAQYEDEQQAALEALQTRKNEEIKQLQIEFKQYKEELNFQLQTQDEVQDDLLAKIKELTDARAADEEKYLELMKKSEEKRNKLQKEIEELKEEYAESVAEIEEEKKEFEKTLLAHRTIEMQREEASHKSNLERLKEEMTKQKIEELEKQSKEFKDLLETEHAKMESVKNQTVEEILRINKQKLNLLLQDYETTKSLLDEKEKYIEELEKEFQCREMQIQELQITTESLEDKTKQLSLELYYQSDKSLKPDEKTAENRRYWVSRLVYIPAFVLFSSTALAFTLAFIFLFFILSFLIPYIPL